MVLPTVACPGVAAWTPLSTANHGFQGKGIWTCKSLPRARHLRTASISDSDSNPLLDFAQKGDFLVGPGISTSNGAPLLVRTTTYQVASTSDDEATQWEHNAHKGDCVRGVIEDNSTLVGADWISYHSHGTRDVQMKDAASNAAAVTGQPAGLASLPEGKEEASASSAEEYEAERPSNGAAGLPSTSTASSAISAPPSREVEITTALESNGSTEAETAIPEGTNAEEMGRYWKGLIGTETRGALHLDGRAGSVADAHVLRRKGHLKEQDGLIEFMMDMHRTHTPYEVMAKMEKWLREHQQDPKRSTLARLIPTIGRLHTPLKLVEALREYDEFASLSRRRYVPPNFAEIRHILNIAQLHSIAEHAALITFDADGTLYADGHHMKDDNKMIGHIINLMKFGVHVAIVTAAGYPGEAHKFEGRLAGLLTAFQTLGLQRQILDMFHVMGGECNYLLRVNDEYRLEFVDDDLWQLPEMLAWKAEDIVELLDEAQAVLQGAAARLRLPVQVIRKQRSVGIVPKQATIYEVLEELALTAQNQLIGAKMPFCAFNGGNDVFVDVGNKSLGLAALMQFFKKKPHETIHVGDRFTVTGNDGATRSKCNILWVANPEETGFFIRMLLRDMRLARMTPYLE